MCHLLYLLATCILSYEYDCTDNLLYVEKMNSAVPKDKYLCKYKIKYS